MKEFIDYYASLGINQNSNSIEIKNAFKKESLKWHPDCNPGIDTNKKMQDINEAKRILSDRKLREKYNKEYKLYKENATKTKHKQSEQRNNTNQSINYVCNLKTDNELIRICANAAKYNFEYIHVVLQELKKRSYSLETINKIIRQKAKSSA